jgi:hypothetical protein
VCRVTHGTYIEGLWLIHKQTLTVAAADGVRFTCVRQEINFLLTFETAPLFCERTVYV